MLFIIFKAIEDNTNIGTIHHADINYNSFDELTVRSIFLANQNK